jgi:hypothetical protein
MRMLYYAIVYNKVSLKSSLVSAGSPGARFTDPQVAETRLRNAIKSETEFGCVYGGLGYTNALRHPPIIWVNASGEDKSRLVAG